ncbi:DUF2062 domain-containing protein [Synechococcus sp. RSCCF101]|uniref:DUF2062 domain-containing protein n=1 Tax=Synechococcus sp. RSCCF101 TaxID=2511069 RepID=UPI0012463C9E|nr:DUF2062 domain-containing protein [Synechococcus sp. RSCCF101]QEY32825.1 DUF2062 domain-containing protein [Synechococcus sp. RSCCF101]
MVSSPTNRSTGSLRHQFRPLRQVRRFTTWLWRQEGTPGQRARGLAVGVFSGCFPFFGLQTLIGIALASLVRGNHLLAAAGTWISNPFTYLPLYWFNYRLGCWLLGPGAGGLDLATLRSGGLAEADLWEQGWSFSSRLLLGSSLVGLAAAAAAGALCWWLLERQAGQAAADQQGQSIRSM